MNLLCYINTQPILTLKVLHCTTNPLEPVGKITIGVVSMT